MSNGVKQENWENIYFSKTGIARRHKVAILEAVSRLTRRAQKPFGLLIILGWQEKWRKKYSLMTDTRQNIFRKRPVLILGPCKRVARILKRTKLFDGALLVHRDGILCDSGIYLTGLQPGLLVEHLGQKLDGDFSQILGFKEPVHSRHLVAITASWQLRGITVYTVSEETKTVRIYEGGRIIYSTISKEIWQPENV